MKAFINVESLSKHYGDLRAVDDVSLSVDEGQTIAIIGPSGCGKSTFLRCVSLLETPSEATLQIGEYKLVYRGDKLVSGAADTLSYRKKMSMVFQGFELFPHMTVIRNVSLAPNVVNKVPTEDAFERAKQLLDRVGLRDKANQYPRHLSGGQAQRVAIARALAMEPRMLLFDEPTSALDPELIGEVLEVIGELAKEGRTMLVVTHELQFAKDVADKVAFFDEGRLVESGKPTEVLDSPNSERLQSFLERYRKAMRA